MINTEKFNSIVEAAKAKTNDPKWLRAIERAAAGVLDGSICVTLFADGYALVTTPTGQHRVNGVCDCKAAQHGHTQCVHRSAKRLIENYETACAVADVETSSRANLIAEITDIWPRVVTAPLAVELMARFGVNRLEYLADDMLKAVRLAVAL